MLSTSHLARFFVGGEVPTTVQPNGPSKGGFGGVGGRGFLNPAGGRQGVPPGLQGGRPGPKPLAIAAPAYGDRALANRRAQLPPELQVCRLGAQYFLAPAMHGRLRPWPCPRSAVQRWRGRSEPLQGPRAGFRGPSCGGAWATEPAGAW